MLFDSEPSSFRPESKNAGWEEPPQDSQPFDVSAVPERFYFGIDSVGNLEPDAIVQQGIKVMQQKLAAVIQELAGTGVPDGVGNGMTTGGGDYVDQNGGMQNSGGGYGTQGSTMDGGYTTPFGNGGGQTAWGGGQVGGQTPYGATPYGNGWGS